MTLAIYASAPAVADQAAAKTLGDHFFVRRGFGQKPNQVR
jgi:hypothetical protein